MGHRSVAEAQKCISSREFSEWAAFNEISPIGRERFDMLAALLACVNANANSTKKTFKLDDFILRWQPKPVRRVPWQEIKAKLQGFALTNNALFRASKGKGGE